MRANGALAMPKSQEQFQALKDVLQSYNEKFYYIDVIAKASNPNDFFYGNDENEVPDSSFWAPNEPDGKGELCVTMEKQSNYSWHDVDCSRQEYFACQFVGQRMHFGDHI